MRVVSRTKGLQQNDHGCPEINGAKVILSEMRAGAESPGLVGHHTVQTLEHFKRK